MSPFSFSFKFEFYVVGLKLFLTDSLLRLFLEAGGNVRVVRFLDPMKLSVPRPYIETQRAKSWFPIML